MNSTEDNTSGSDSSRCSTFTEHRDKTVADLQAVVKDMENLIESVREGDVKAFERFWIEGGTEEGDARIFHVREILVLRYMVREESVTSNT